MKNYASRVYYPTYTARFVNAMQLDQPLFGLFQQLRSSSVIAVSARQALAGTQQTLANIFCCQTGEGSDSRGTEFPG
jgi:hypothetical protein